MSGTQPYLSVVMVARNDNYGGDFTSRLAICLKNLNWLNEIYKIPLELIVVEWNPPLNAIGLLSLIKEKLEFQKISFLLRVITVPREIHYNVAKNVNTPLLEYTGKNVGIRRANGEFILVTNPDIIFSSELFKFFSSKTLSQSRLYRVDRYDVKSPIPKFENLSDLQSYCENNVTMVFSGLGIYDLRYGSSIKQKAIYMLRRIKYLPNYPPHLYAPGDFLLMHRDDWHMIGGFAEFDQMGEAHHIDSLAVLMAKHLGIKQRSLSNKLRIFHQEHMRRSDTKPLSALVFEAYNKLKQGEFPKELLWRKNWGLPNITLAEEMLQNSSNDLTNIS